VGKGRLKERCRLESQTNFLLFKKSPKTECGLDSRIYGIRIHLPMKLGISYLNCVVTDGYKEFSTYDSRSHRRTRVPWGCSKANSIRQVINLRLRTQIFKVEVLVMQWNLMSTIPWYIVFLQKSVIPFHHHHHHRHLSVMELAHLLTRSSLTHPEFSSKMCHDSFCQLGNSVSLS